MSAYDIAKDTIRIASTAGLGKDVIDLLEKKLALLTDEVASLQQENGKLRSEKQDLLEGLNRALAKIPKGQDALPVNSEENAILILLSQCGREQPHAEEIAHHLKLSNTKTEYLLTLLEKRELVHYSIYVGSPCTYYLTPKGTAFLVENGFVE